MTKPCDLNPRPPYCIDEPVDNTGAIVIAICVSAVVVISICCIVCCCCCKHYKRCFEDDAVKEKRKKAEAAFAES